MGNNLETRRKGVSFVTSWLAEKGWEVGTKRVGRAELHTASKGSKSYVLSIRALKNQAPVPYRQGLAILDHVDYVVICYNLEQGPRTKVVEPDTTRGTIHKDTTDEKAYWLQYPAYNRHGMSFDHVFG